MIRALAFLLAAAAVYAQAPESDAESKPASRGAETRPVVIHDHPRLGVTVEAERLDKDNIARVSNVAPGSPAATAGLRPGDEILKVADVPIVNDAVYRRTMAAQKIGSKVKVVYKRDNKEETVEIELTDFQKPRPDHIVVQHCLISFATAKSPSNGAKRTMLEARELAEEVKRRILAGEDINAVIKENTDDVGSKNKTPAGEYRISDSGKPPPPGGMTRDGLVPGFGAMSFLLSVGEIQILPYDPELSPFGFHVIKRTA
jgi:membrane-associated protease RseP (regulator of RpoE activity)